MTDPSDPRPRPPDEPTPPGEEPRPSRRAGTGSERLVGAVVDGGGAIADAVADGREAIADTLRPAVHAVRPMVRHVVTRTERRLARHRHRRRRGPLANLFEVHPKARDAPLREVGVLTVPVDEIVGTAVEGPAQRGRDFTPLPPFRSSNWRGRWQRILAAAERLEPLPPIDVLKTSDGYWVTDGHNRVAAARVTGQVEIDASVRRVVLPGEPIELPAGPLAPLLAGRDQVEAAGSGALSPGITLGQAGRAPVHDAVAAEEEGDAAAGDDEEERE